MNYLDTQSIDFTKITEIVEKSIEDVLKKLGSSNEFNKCAVELLMSKWVENVGYFHTKYSLHDKSSIREVDNYGDHDYEHYIFLLQQKSFGDGENKAINEFEKDKQ